MSDKAIDSVVKSKNIGNYKRHFLLCTGPKCIDEDTGMQVWAYLKKRIKEENIESSCYRSKVGCLRICIKGPIALVYPEGTWYKLVDEKAVDEIIEEHIKGGRPVEKYKIAENPL